MPSTATVTGKIGPAGTITAAVFTNVSSFSLDCAGEILSLFFNDGKAPVLIDVGAATTWTLTVSGNSYTLTVA